MPLNNLSKEPPIPFIGTVVEFNDQKEQISGQGWGWRYKVAIMNDYSSRTEDIKNSQIEYALALIPNDAGSGASNYAKSLKIRQGDIVYGHKVVGKRGINLILGLFGRTKDTKLGDNRFDAKTGYTDEVTEPDGEVSTSGETNEPDGQEPPVQLPKTKATQAHRAV